MAGHFLVQYDQTGSNPDREAKRPEHIAYRKAIGADLILAGPLLGDDGQPVGSVILIAREDKAAAETFANGDPFVAAGLLKLRSVQAMRIAAISPPPAS
jgi:uncharacterized protein